MAVNLSKMSPNLQFTGSLKQTQMAGMGVEAKADTVLFGNRALQAAKKVLDKRAKEALNNKGTEVIKPEDVQKVINSGSEKLKSVCPKLNEYFDKFIKLVQEYGKKIWETLQKILNSLKGVKAPVA